MMMMYFNQQTCWSNSQPSVDIFSDGDDYDDDAKHEDDDDDYDNGDGGNDSDQLVSMPDKTCNVDIDDYDYVDEKDDGDKYDYFYDDDLSLLVPAWPPRLAMLPLMIMIVMIMVMIVDDNDYYDRDKYDDEEGLIGSSVQR